MGPQRGPGAPTAARFGAFGFSSVPLPSAALARWAVGTGPCFAPGLGPALAVLSKQFNGSRNIASWLSQWPRVSRWSDRMSSAATLMDVHAVGLTPLSGARRIATLARSGQQACAGTCALRHHSRHNSAPALPPPSDDVRWGQSTPASSLIAREARPLAAASDLRRRLDRRWPRWRPT